MYDASESKQQEFESQHMQDSLWELVLRGENDDAEANEVMWRAAYLWEQCILQFTNFRTYLLLHRCLLKIKIHA